MWTAIIESMADQENPSILYVLEKQSTIYNQACASVATSHLIKM